MSRVMRPSSVSTMAYAFVPVHAYDSSPGCYVQLPRVRNAPSMLSREDCLGYLRARLWLKAARILADGNSTAVIARMVERPGVLFDSGRRRWERFEKMIRSQRLNKSSSRIIRSCKQDLSNRRRFVDFLLDDTALTWQWAASADYSLSEMEACRTELEQNYMPIHPLFESVLEDKSERFLDNLFRYPGEEGYKLINMLMYCLCRAQSLGDIFEYAFTYALIMSVARFNRQVTIAIMRDGNEGSVRKGWRSFGSFFSKSDYTVGFHLWLAFWQEFGRFVQDWYSRIRLVNNSPRDRGCLADRLYESYLMSNVLFLRSSARVVHQQMIS
ncbi:hypothetical protein OKW27_003982 [Paraburkholderia sp. 35.1]